MEGTEPEETMQGGGEGRLGDGEGESGGGGSCGRRGRWGGARVLDRGRLFILLLEKGVVACHSGAIDSSTHQNLLASFVRNDRRRLDHEREETLGGQ